MNPPSKHCRYKAWIFVLFFNYNNHPFASGLAQTLHILGKDCISTTLLSRTCESFIC